ncbi:MAG: efflux RND transporter periplasmic adaptor subunit [Bacteroidota bacterium]|nr:efflux RND transporter periplasmic adaptor subunit [Bacteroidota bacterium]MDP4251380.1 efflux RND transporter periplasmic adaptor subunit [Bacteroidota bacterium]
MKQHLLLPFVIIPVLLFSCKSGEPAKAEEPPAAITPVTVTTVSQGPVSDSLELNANSAYLQNSYIKSTATGFVKSVSIKPGDYVENGRLLFTIETKESSVIGNTISKLDSSFKFSGLISVKAQGHGFITQLNHQTGDYVQDGEQLAVISDRNSFVFLLNMPYEYRNIVLNSKSVLLTLPDGTRLTGRIGTVFPSVDSLTQTQTVVIKVNSATPIPQNLIARVHILREIKNRAQTVPRSAVLADEAQTEFWVMKLTDSNTAVKIPVKKGLEFADKIEITDPVFSPGDRILVSGNFGLPDTAKVLIEK